MSPSRPAKVAATLRLDIPDTATITNLAGVPLAGLPYTSGQIYTILQATVFRSQGPNDGWIRRVSENSNQGGTIDVSSTTFRLGDSVADAQFRSILHFNTALLPDNAIITKATLKIRKAQLMGKDPFTVLGSLLVDMRRPFFGGNADSISGDFQAKAGRSKIAQFGARPVNNWYIAASNAAGRVYINKGGSTQFRLYFQKDDNDDQKENLMLFFSGNYASVSARPTLIIEYYVP